MKWRLVFSDAEVGADLFAGNAVRGCVTNSEWSGMARPAAWSNVRQVLVSSVTSPDYLSALQDMLPDAVFYIAQSHGRCDGLLNGYTDPGRLGVDRWLAMLAAWSRDRGAFVMIDAGTAITIDLVDAGGRHRGGYICAGFGLQRHGLSNSPKLRPASQGYPKNTPALTTSDALDAGLGVSATGAAVLARQWAARNHTVSRRCPIFLTGGDGSLLRPFLQEAQYVQDLVLEGLFRQAQSEQALI